MTRREKRLLARLSEGVEVVEAIEKLQPHEIGARHYGWLRDWLAGARACLAALTPVKRAPKPLPPALAHHERARVDEANEAEEVKVGVWAAVLTRARGCCEACASTRPLEPHHLILGSRDDAPEVVMALCAKCHRTGPRSAHNAPRHFALNFVVPWAARYGYPLPNRKEYRT